MALANWKTSLKCFILMIKPCSNNTIYCLLAISLTCHPNNHAKYYPFYRYGSSTWGEVTNLKCHWYSAKAGVLQNWYSFHFGVCCRLVPCKTGTPSASVFLMCKHQSKLLGAPPSFLWRLSLSMLLPRLVSQLKQSSYLGFLKCWDCSSLLA